jgi:hypothetical protein
MPEPIRCLRRVFPDEICRGVAAIAGRDPAMRRLQPAVELFAHHMAVGAGRRVVSKIGPTLGIGESVYADADSDADNHAEQDALNGVNLHLHLSLVRNRLQPHL